MLVSDAKLGHLRTVIKVKVMQRQPLCLKCSVEWNGMQLVSFLPYHRKLLFAAKRLNVTSGSLEALGGDVSRGDL